MTELPPAMPALQLHGPNDLRRVEIPTPAPAEDELLIRTQATTICTSDLGDMRDNPFGIPLPRVLGHEAAGIVAACGANVTGFDVGDRVATHPVIPCNHCDMCRRGWGHLCGSSGHLAADRDGTFAGFYRIPAVRARRIPDPLDIAEAALLEPVAVCLEAVRQAGIRRDANALIAGDGPFGVMMALLAGRIGARTILAGCHDFRLQAAPEAAALRVDRAVDPLERIRELTGGRGVDAAILAVDSQSALDLCLESLRPKGRLAIFAIMPDRPTINMIRVLVRELEIVGAVNDENLIDEALRILVEGELGLDRIVTHRLPFDRWAEAIDLAANRPGEALKVALMFDESGQ